MEWKKLALICLVLIAVMMAWIWRYEIVSANQYAYRLDRWTGNIEFIHNAGYWDLEKK